MSWNTSVLLAEGKSLADMKRAIPDVFCATKRVIGWEDASSSALDRDVAIGAFPGWGVLWTPNIQVTLFPDVLEIASQRGRALTLVLSGVNSLYGFCLYVGGREVRRLLRKNFQTFEEAGAVSATSAVLGATSVVKRRPKIAIFDLIFIISFIF